MDEIKNLIKRGSITSVVILVYGLIIKEKIVYMGMFIGSLLSILSFYMICMDVKSIAARGGSYKAGIISYLKRYVIYGLALGIATYFFGIGMMLSTAIGLLNIKFNIYLMVLYKNFIKFKSKYLK
ncbi:ATPase [Fusobacterium sp.]|uniref:ATPase n=1 Tax=Fusobacterium sp. TaxID=68766 RepID=UPI002618A64A|nr:ATPase [Fusobacterium sp.]